MYSGDTAAQALAATLQVARACDAAGYHRYWVAEHHGSSAFAGCAPELLVASLAAQTSRIRVGSGGVMLSHYSPYKVAESFLLLEALHTGRIDLGVGRAPGGDAWQAGALAYGSKTTSPEYFGRKLADLQAWLSGEAPQTEAFTKVAAEPRCQVPPELWLLVSSPGGLSHAVEAQLPIAIAHFIDHRSIALASRYRQQMGEGNANAKVILACLGIAAPTAEEAQELAIAGAVWRHRSRQGRFGPFPKASEITPEELEAANQRDPRAAQLVGTPESVVDALLELRDQAQADELMLVTILPTVEARIRSYQLIYEEFSKRGVLSGG